MSRKSRSPSVNRGRRQRSLTLHPVNPSPVTPQSSKYITANANDLNAESSRFHEFATDEPVQELEDDCCVGIALRDGDNVDILVLDMAEGRRAQSQYGRANLGI